MDDVINDAVAPIHPGEILQEEFLEPLGVTPNHLARRLAVPSQRVYEILAGRRSISLDTALRLASFFGTSWQMWRRLQERYELQLAQQQGLVERVAAEVQPLRDDEKLCEDEKSRKDET